MLAQLGIREAASEDPKENPNYIGFGSDAHAQFLGLVKVQEGDDLTGFETFTSQESGVTYRLEDEIGAVSLYPGLDPAKAAILVLRQKVNVLEGGEPEAPANAPDPYILPDGVVRI
jgi:hypothetical protein